MKGEELTRWALMMMMIEGKEDGEDEKEESPFLRWHNGGLRKAPPTEGNQKKK